MPCSDSQKLASRCIFNNDIGGKDSERCTGSEPQCGMEPNRATSHTRCAAMRSAVYAGCAKATVEKYERAGQKMQQGSEATRGTSMTDACGGGGSVEGREGEQEVARSLAGADVASTAAATATSDCSTSTYSTKGALSLPRCARLQARLARASTAIWWTEAVQRQGSTSTTKPRYDTTCCHARLSRGATLPRDSHALMTTCFRHSFLTSAVQRLTAAVQIVNRQTVD